jgi:uncharacterized protein YwqG
VEWLEAQIKKCGLGKYPQLALMPRPSVRLRPSRTRMDRMAMGRSRLGGLPDLPMGMEWPRWDQGPLTPMAVLNLADIAKVMPSSPLPSGGWLVFWFDTFNQPIGFSPADRGGYRVDYIPEKAKLYRPSIPADFRRDHDEPTAKVYEACSVDPKMIMTMPPYQDIEASTLGLPFEQVGDYITLLERWVKRHGENNGSIVLGHPYVEQNEMRTQCQYVYAGFKYGPVSARAFKKLIAPGINDWTLLAQFGPEPKAPSWMFGDVGNLYYWIRQQDLEAGRFDAVVGTWQCG